MTFFKDSEFKNRAKMDQHTIDCLEYFRGDIGIPITLTSDYADDGHSTNSWHYKGKAIDGAMNAPLWSFVSKAMRAGFTGIGVYLVKVAGVFVVKYFHLDTRDTAPQFWIGVVQDNGSIQYMYELKKG